MSSFEELALIYDASIDWDSRLARELPFLMKVLEKKKKGRILDLGCGSGRHAIALAKKGFSVIGLDTSIEMIETAVKHSRETDVSAEFLVSDMADAEKVVEGPFDLILCLGNSLALLPQYEVLHRTISSIHSLLREEGVLVSQILNFTEIRKTGFRFFVLREGCLASGEKVIFSRFFVPVINTETVSLVLSAFIKQPGGWVTKITTQQCLQLDGSILDNLFRTVGYSKWDFYSDFKQNPFDSEYHRNLILVARH
ncbi:MAG: class I SAM-dependent methyltransferase [Promethearchaeota archaeon]